MMHELDKITWLMEQIAERLTSTQIGLDNIYKAFTVSQEAIKKERKMLEDKELQLLIKSYPMNTRVKIKIETNFGAIDYALDYPPIIEGSIGDFLHNLYNNLLNELYDAHEERGGKFMGDAGAKEWWDNNAPTIIHKEPSNSPRVRKENNV